MLQFEEIKNALLREHKRLEIIIEAQTELLETMKPLDGKMYNKKIPEAIEAGGKFHSYIWGDRKELVISIKDIESKLPKMDRYLHRDYNEGNVFWKLKATITDEEEKRFSYQKAREELLRDIQTNRGRLAEINADLIDGADRLREAEKVMEYYKQIARSFSGYVLSNYRKHFDVGWIG